MLAVVATRLRWEDDEIGKAEVGNADTGGRDQEGTAGEEDEG